MRVLLATDGSDEARAAAEWLAALPWPPCTRFLVLTVVTPPHSPLDIPPVQAFTQSLFDAARGVVAETKRTLNHQWPEVETRVREGDPRQEILRAAEDWAADLIAVGERRLGAVRGFLGGSVSKAVANEARCPVLVVRARPRRSNAAVRAVRWLSGFPRDQRLPATRQCPVRAPLGQDVRACLTEIRREDEA
jgi:nucleotide-binding universal stress UspA family protein